MEITQGGIRQIRLNKKNTARRPRSTRQRSWTHFDRLLVSLCCLITLGATSCQRANVDRKSSETASRQPLPSAAIHDTALETERFLDESTCLHELGLLAKSTDYVKQQLIQSPQIKSKDLKVNTDGINVKGDFMFKLYDVSQNGDGAPSTPWQWFQIRKSPPTLFALDIAADSLIMLPCDTTKLALIINHCIDWSDR